MLFYLLLTFGLSLVFPWLSEKLSGTYRWSLALWPFAGFLLFMALPAQSVNSAWLPQIGFHFALRLDGLSRLFALLITGIGSLVFVYSAKYLAAHPGRNRFYGFITLFMASMLGLVLADDWLLMFVCWELTSISSFFYCHQLPRTSCAQIGHYRVKYNRVRWYWAFWCRYFV